MPNTTRILKITLFLFIAMIVTACQLTPKITKDAATKSYENIPPAISQWMPEPAVLVFSKTKGWRHNEGIAGADLFFAQRARESGYGFFTTENAAVFNQVDLNRFEIIVFNNASGDILSPQQEIDFQQWLENGGAWIGIHGAGDGSHVDWPWYGNSLIGPKFIGHPKQQFHTATLEILSKEHPILTGLPENWRHSEEWYSFDSRPQDYGLTPLVGVNEADYLPADPEYKEDIELRMGQGAENHPIIWSGCVGKGRIFYSALGHSDLAYNSPENRQILTNAFKWVQNQTDSEASSCP